MYTIEQYQEIAEEMILKDQERDAKFRDWDKAYFLENQMPDDWTRLGWIRWFPSTKLPDSLDTAIRALITKTPSLSITPTRGNKETRAQFNKLEKGLKWILMQASRRSQSNPVRDMATSAVRYDEIAAQVVYLPEMAKAHAALTGKRKKRAERYGDFAVIVHHPGSVHSVCSDYMPEKVLLVRQQMVSEVLSFWGEAAKEIREAVVGDDPKVEITDYCTVYDYIDDEARVVWASVATTSRRQERITDQFAQSVTQSKQYTLAMQENKSGFIPWVIRVGGVSLDSKPEDKRRPVHRTIMDTDQIYTGDMLRSLLLSKVMARAASPDAVTKTINGEGVEVDASTPFASIDLKPGEDYQRLPAQQIDPALLQAQQMLSAEIDSATGVEMLRAMQNVSGMAFATFSAAMQVALTTVDPPKRITELALADTYALFVAWLKETGNPLVFYSNARGDEMGEYNEISAEELPEDQDLYLNVQLKPYVPTDEMSKINAQQVLVNTMQYPTARALENLDVEDAEQAIEEWRQEQLDKAAVQEEVKDLQFEADLPRQQRLQQMQMEMQMQSQQMQMQQQAQMQMPPEQMAGPGQPGSQMPVDQSGMPMPGAFPGGMNFNPNMGGSSPVEGAPDIFSQLSGPDLQMAEGRDNRGLRVPPEGRAPRE